MSILGEISAGARVKVFRPAQVYPAAGGEVSF
jgi:hypothetical protein